MNNLLPERTVERLSEYRRMLLKNFGGGNTGKTHIYSHELASLHGITAVQVRRDLMLIGFSSDTKRGYRIKELIGHITDILEGKTTTNVAVVGMGNMASAITTYFNNRDTQLRITASFDVDPSKVGCTIAGIPCYDVKSLVDIVRERNIKILILSLPASKVSGLMDDIVRSGVGGILNFTAWSLNFDKGIDIYVEDFDILTLLEKIAYFSNNR